MKSLASVVLMLVILAQVASVGQSGESSFPTTDSEASGESVFAALEKLLSENRKLRAEAEDNRKLAANATIEAEVFKRQVQELMLRMEALGGSTADPSRLEQRLLQAVHDLQISERSRKTLAAEFVRIAEVAHAYLEKPDAETRLVFESELKRAEEVLVKSAVGDFDSQEASPQQPSPDLLNGKVSAVKLELGCVVINVGTNHGVKAGMPFQVRRGDKVVASLRVVDARQGFSVAVIQNLVSDRDPIKLGDPVKVDTQLN